MKIVQTRFLELLAEKQRKQRRSISREQVAQETGVSLSSVQNWALNRLVRFDSKQISAFCDYFNCEVSDLLILVEVEELDSPESERRLTAIA